MIANSGRLVSAFGRAVLDRTELAAVVAKAVDAGLAIVLCEPGSKRPVCTLTTPTARSRADKQAREAAKEAGVERWDRVRHECGLKHALEGDGTKAKAVFRKVQEKWTDAGVLNIAVVPGRSRMVVVDVDTEDQAAAFFEEAGLPEWRGLTVQSPGLCVDGVWVHKDGGHIWFELPEGVELPPSPGKLTAPSGWVAMWGESYVLVPPSARSEGPYVFSDPDVPQAPDWLIRMIREARPEPKEGGSGPKAPGDPVDEWAAEAPWTVLLNTVENNETCWDYTGKADACGCPIWTAPGGRADPKSATAHEIGCSKVDTSTGHGPLHIWTDAPPSFLEGRRNVTKLQYVAARDHGGNIAAAMRSLGLRSTLQAVPGDPFDLADGVNAPEEVDRPFTRIVDLSGWLDGSRTPPQPSIGASRDDGQTMLYPAKWHTVIGLTTAGKSWLALWHAKAVLEGGGCVVYVHFEESDPGPTLDRLVQLGVEREVIRDRFVWLDNGRIWKLGDMGGALEELEQTRGYRPGLVILDGLNAGASRQGWKLNDAETVTLYRGTYVAAAVKRGAAVLSLGHPVKDRTRQDEIHSFGSTAWLDEVDGVSFRMVAASRPIRKGHLGSSWVSVVKDRAGGLTQACEIEQGKAEAWYSLGEFVLDDSETEFGGTGRHMTGVWMRRPRKGEENPEMDRIGELAQKIITVLIEMGGRYETKEQLAEVMRGVRPPVKFIDKELGPALTRLERDGVIGREPFKSGRPQPGWLVPEVGE